MRVERGRSQILFGMLPAQTVDLQGSVWRVSSWVDPVEITIDQATVRNGLLEAIAPWASAGMDDEVSRDLMAGAPVEVVEVNTRRGVEVEPFPRQWRCKACGRISNERTDQCRCGSSSVAQMQFVAYHACGALREPRLPKCPTHRSVAVRLPGTSTSRELHFFCPDCRQPLSSGFPFQPCDCGINGVPVEGMHVTVHRAGVVYTARYAVLVNPPDPAAAARDRATGGGARALEWVLDGMGTRALSQGGQTADGLLEALLQQGLSMETARELTQRALDRGEVRSGSASFGSVALPDDIRHKAQEEALSLSSATADGRVRVADMVEGSTPPLRTLYQSAYQAAMVDAKLVNVELLTNFPVATIAFGYTRGDQAPGSQRLVVFRDRRAIRGYGSLSRTEALLFQLDPLAVHTYLSNRDHKLEPADCSRGARLAVLKAAEVPTPFDQQTQPLGKELLTLLHSYTHRMVRSLAGVAGIERDALAEYLLPHHLSAIIYASPRGEFVLGGLQAVFETSLHRVLDDFANGEYRCPLDPGCRSGGGACMACLHLGEPSCRWFNRFLDRSVLFGEQGFLRSD